MKLDFYRGVNDPRLRMAVMRGNELPDHVEPKDWVLMEQGTAEIAVEDDVEEDIEARGFSFYKLV